MVTKEKVFAIIRHTLTFVGGFLVMKGIIDESVIESVIASSLTLTGVIWSIFDKK